MKRIYLIFVFLFYFNFSFSQCVGSIVLVSNPLPDSLGCFAQGTSVTFNLTVNGYDSTAWFEGLNINYGNGWDINSLQTISPGNSNNGNGAWEFYNSSEIYSSCEVYGIGFYYDIFDAFGFLDGIPGNDYGDFNLTGNGNWTFSWSIFVDSLATNTSLNGNIILIGYPANTSFCESIISMNSILDSSACHAEFSMAGSFFSEDSIQFSNNSLGNFNNILWSLGDGTTYSSNSFIHSYSDSGIFNVCLLLSDSTGCSDSVCTNVSICPSQINSINNISENQIELFVYPNPVSDILNLIIPLRKKTDCVIFDILSSKKYLLKINKGENKIDVSKLPSGIYFIKLFNNQDSFVSKFVKE